MKRMNKRIISLLMTVLMVFMLMPAMVFAEGQTEQLSGSLDLQGMQTAGSEFRADYVRVSPWISDDYVSFQWYRISEDDLQWLNQSADRVNDLSFSQLSTQSSYSIKEDDIGYHIILMVSGLPEYGVSGTLTVISKAIVSAEEADTIEAEGTSNRESGVDEAVRGLESRFAPVEEVPEEIMEEPYEETYEESYEEEMPGEDPYAFPEDNSEVESYYEETPEENESSLPFEYEEESWDNSDAGFEIFNEEVYSTEAQEEVVPEEIHYEAEVIIEEISEETKDILDFGVLSEEDEITDEMRISFKVKNIGNAPLNFDEIAPEHFMVQDIHDPLMPEEEITLWAVPRKGLAPAEYEDVITYTTKEGAKAEFTAKVIITVKEEPTPIPEPTEEPTPTPVPTEEPTPTPVPTEEPTPTPEPTEEPTPTPVPTEEPTPTPVPTEEPAPTPIPAIFDVKGVDPETITFNPVMEGYTSEPAEIKVVYICSEGMNAVVNITADSGNFILKDVPAEALPIAPEKGIFTFKVMLKEGLPAGTYTDTLKLFVNGEKTENLLQVSATVNKSVSSIAIDPSVVDFGVLNQGESALATATIRNTGNNAVILSKPAATNFTISGADGVKLAPGESVTIKVEPIKGILPGEYTQNADVWFTDTNKVSDKITFAIKARVNKKAEVVKITGIVNPAEIKDLPNGTPKEPQSLRLPSTVVVNTTKGQMQAGVTWDVSKAPYDPTSPDAQQFPVTGQVALPNGVTNPDKIQMLTATTVYVKAADAKLADPSENKITGITGSYTTTSRITFTAVGAGMSNESPKSGDTRYLPEKWAVVNTYAWDKAPYSASFGMAKAGDYTLSVSFKQQKFDGNTWKDTGENDVKKIAFNVAKSDVTPTAVPGQSLTPAAHKPVVNTGDNTPIIALIAILVAAAAAIAGIIGYKVFKK